MGTNGKGTTAVSLAAALEATGFPSGAYLSPHVLSYTERVMLRGAYVSEERFAAAMGKAIAVADANGVPASQFELLTAGTLGLFAWLMFLFLRLLPMISMFEMRTIIPQARVRETPDAGHGSR